MNTYMNNIRNNGIGNNRHEDMLHMQEIKAHYGLNLVSIREYRDSSEREMLYTVA